MVKFSRNNFRTNHACLKFVFSLVIFIRKKERNNEEINWKKKLFIFHSHTRLLLYSPPYSIRKFWIFITYSVVGLRLYSLRIPNREWRIKIARDFLPQNFISPRICSKFLRNTFSISPLFRERSVNIFYSNEKGILFTNSKRIQNFGKKETTFRINKYLI